MMTTYRALKFPLISKNSFEQEWIFRSMNAVEAVVAIDNPIKKIGIYGEGRKLTPSYRTKVEHTFGPT